jgi:hypothetical protein
MFPEPPNKQQQQQHHHCYNHRRRRHHGEAPYAWIDKESAAEAYTSILQ